MLWSDPVFLVCTAYFAACLFELVEVIVYSLLVLLKSDSFILNQPKKKKKWKKENRKLKLKIIIKFEKEKEKSNIRNIKNDLNF